MNVNLRKTLIWSPLVLLTVVGLIYGFQPQPRLVEVAEVKRAPLEVTVEEEGKTRVIDRYIVSAPVAGTTCRTDLDVGDKVQKDEPLINIRPMQSQALDPRSRAQAQARVSGAESALRAAEQQARSAAEEAEFARREYDRLKPLAAQGHVAKETLDQAATALRSSKAVQRSADFSVDVALHELEAARTALHYTGEQGLPEPTETVVVRAPVTGSILKLHQECEGVVSPGQPLMEIGDTRSLEIETDVLSADAVRIKPEMRVMFDRWGGEEPLQGRVRRVEPVGFTKVSALGVEEQRVLVISDITSDSELWQNLGDGYRVEARFILWETDNALQIPASALFHFDDGWAVFVMQDDKAMRRRVKVGRRNGLSAQILDGLSENVAVITHPDDTIDDGVRIKLR